MDAGRVCNTLEDVELVFRKKVGRRRHGVRCVGEDRPLLVGDARPLHDDILILVGGLGVCLPAEHPIVVSALLIHPTYIERPIGHASLRYGDVLRGLSVDGRIVPRYSREVENRATLGYRRRLVWVGICRNLECLFSCVERHFERVSLIGSHRLREHPGIAHPGICERVVLLDGVIQIAIE